MWCYKYGIWKTQGEIWSAKKWDRIITVKGQRFCGTMYTNYPGNFFLANQLLAISMLGYPQNSNSEQTQNETGKKLSRLMGHLCIFRICNGLSTRLYGKTLTRLEGNSIRGDGFRRKILAKYVSVYLISLDRDVF